MRKEHNTMGINNIKTFILLALSSLLMAVACTRKIGEDVLASVSVKTPEAEASAGSQWVKVQAGGSWTLSIEAVDDSEESDLEWIWLKETSGTGNYSVLLGWEENKGDDARYCKIVLTADGERHECDFMQKAINTNKTVTIENFKSDPVPTWLELPSVTTTDKLYYLNHEMKLSSGKFCRNYSFLYDIDHHVALWVAYPLNSTLIGKGSRHFSGTSYWGGTLDPKVPRSYQAVTEYPYTGSWGYNRGHQIPSADRLTNDANFQTFYGTNMTPQNGDFNSNAWATLEGMVRSWANKFDTLYVVTGCDVRGSKKTISDNDSKKIAIPEGYFKALLGYRKGGTFGIAGKTGGYTAIGFYFENEPLGQIGTTEVMSYSMTIDDLEKKLGYDFFPGLAKKTSSADMVESAKDSWWN